MSFFGLLLVKKKYHEEQHQKSSRNSTFKWKVEIDESTSSRFDILARYIDIIFICHVIYYILLICYLYVIFICYNTYKYNT